MLKEFRDFAVKGNVLDMAVGIIIGGAFGTIVKSLVGDVLMPGIGLLLGQVDFSNLFLVIKGGSPVGPYATIEAAAAAGAVTINYGLFINHIISFLIVAFSVFILVKNFNRFKKAEEKKVSTKKCPECLSEIPLKATRCSHCSQPVKEKI